MFTELDSTICQGHACLLTQISHHNSRIAYLECKAVPRKFRSISTGWRLLWRREDKNITGNAICRQYLLAKVHVYSFLCVVRFARQLSPILTSAVVAVEEGYLGEQSSPFWDQLPVNAGFKRFDSKPSRFTVNMLKLRIHNALKCHRS